MDAKETLNKIKTILGLEVNFETRKLENGTTFESEKFENGSEVFILTEDEQKIPVPQGTYLMEDNSELVVEEEGIIASLGYKKDEDEMKEEEEEEMKDDGKEADVEDWAGMEKRIKNLEDAVADLKADKESKKDAEKEEEKVEEDAVDMSNQQLSEDVKTFKHNPEAKVETNLGIQYGQKRRRTTIDNVYAKLFGNN
jgi:hypothetical protein